MTLSDFEPATRARTTLLVSGETDQCRTAVWSPGTAVTPATDGAVASYLRSNGGAAARFPATSMQDPATDAAALPGPPYELWVQLATPDMSSTPVKATRTGWLYQPPASGGRDAAPTIALGAVASYWRPNAVRPTFPALSTHVPETAPVRLSG